MKKNAFLKNILITAAMVSIYYLIMKYHDTEAFQTAMKCLFNPDADMALPSLWQDNRMMISTSNFTNFSKSISLFKYDRAIR